MSLTSKDLRQKGFYSALEVPGDDDEQIVKSDFPEEIEHHSRGRSTHTTPIEMQQTIDSESNVGVPNRFCSVCGDTSTGIHFGGNSCESCKAFFRRSVQCQRHQNYKCSNDEQCPVNLVTRKVCQFCRYKKCTTIGMKPKWVLSDQEREEKYGARRKRFRQNQTNDEDPEIYKHLTKEEKSLIEDIAHALYQSRVTYSLQFPAELTQYLKLLASGAPPPPQPPPSTSNATTQKPPNPSANFLIVPIQRLVLFARMLKDFDLFSEDDKVNLLKGSAVEVIVCSSNTLFNPKTHTFTNYLSRDQRAVMDDQIIPLDPLLMKLWGVELFHRTKNFLISMCNLHIDEVTSTLLVPVILFSPDRSNIQDLDLVKRLQVKYVTLLKKYMNWRYGCEASEHIYPKLLLQIVNIRTLSLAHSEIIQKVMSTSSVDPLVKEVTAKQEVFTPPTPVSIPSTPMDCSMTDSIKTPAFDAESSIGSDDEESTRKKPRTSIDEDDSNETNLDNIWKKRRKYSLMNQTEITNLEQTNSPLACSEPSPLIKQEYLRSNSNEYDKHSVHNHPPRKPHDHQVPNFIPTIRDDLMLQNRNLPYRHLPPKKQSSLVNRNSYHRIHSSASASDLTSFEHHPRSHSSRPSEQYYPDRSFDNHPHYHPTYPPMSPATYQQHQNEQHLLLLSLANKQNANPTTIHPTGPLDADEQQLLDAIHAHPNKRDLVLNLLRQMNETSSIESFHSNQPPPPPPPPSLPPHQRSSTNSDSYRHYSNKME